MKNSTAMRTLCWHGWSSGLVVLGLIAGSGNCQTGSTEDRALQAARARQDVVKTLSVDYRRTETTARGGVSDAWPFEKLESPVPARETTLESTSRLILDGDKFRVEENHPAYHLPTGAIHRREIIIVFDGSLRSFFLPKGFRGNEPAQGAIAKDVSKFVKTIHLMPITVAFRGLSPNIGSYRVNDMKPTGARLLIDGSRCEEYVISYSPNNSVSFWLDPNKDYLVRRHRRRVQQRLLDQTDITYRRDETWGWVPASWARTEYSASNTPRTSMNIEVLDLRINDPQPSEQFKIRFPPGCVVEDQTTMKDYVIQDDGGMRERSPQGELLTDSIPQPGTPWYRRHQGLLISGAVVVVLLAFTHFLRRKVEKGK